MTTFNIRTAKLRSGEQFRDAREVELEPLELGGERYVPIPEKPEAVLTLTQTSSGLVLELELEVRMMGPCFRCLGDAALPVSVRSREYQAMSPDGSDELATPYLVDDRLDLSAWARDASRSRSPTRSSADPDCAGLCPVCGRDLNAEPHQHEEPEADPRWAALSELRDKL